MTLSLNGVPQTSNFSAVVHTAPYFEAVYPAGHVYPASIVTPDGRELVPLHAIRHPGLYIRAHILAESPRIDLSGDMQKTQQESADPIVEETMNEIAATPPSGPGAPLQAYGFSAEEIDGTLATSTRQKWGLRRCVKGDSVRHFELAMAVDNSLCAHYGNSLPNLVAKLSHMISAGNRAFRQSLCLRMILTYVDAHCNNPDDPYQQLRSLVPRKLLARLALFWFTQRTGVPRDAAVFASGFTDGSTTAGIAFVSGACNPLTGISWIEGLQTKVFMHEIGHLLGANHSTNGLMMPVLTKKTPLWFSNISVVEMRKFLERDVQSTCINKNRRLCGKRKCLGKCVKGVCILSSDTPMMTIPPGRSTGTCAQSFKPAAPPACMAERSLQLIIFSTGAIIAPTFRIAYGKAHIRFQALAGGVSLSVGMRIGSVPTRTFRPRIAVNIGVYERELGNMAAPGGSEACCYKKLFLKAILDSCKSGRCHRIVAIYSTTLRCPRVCFRKGKPLAMKAFRKCPRCA